MRYGHIGSDPKTLNPLIATDATSADFGGKLYPGLVENDPDTNEVVPRLAESFELKDSGKKIIIRSSTVHEDGNSRSFAGFFESVLNVNSQNYDKVLSGLNKVKSSYA